MQTTLHQQPVSYTAADHQVWSLLYTRQLNAIRQYAYKNFETGLSQLNFTADRIPDLGETNRLLEALTGWKIYAVPGLIPNHTFFKLMVYKRFGATTWIRKMEELDYLEEPDMFHDVFGHVPLLTDPAITGFLLGLAHIAERYLDQEAIIEAIARLYWYTIEFGLVQEGEEIKIYGAGILSSIGETKFALSEEADRRPFNLEEVLQTPYIKDKFQEQYFVLNFLGQLKEILKDLDQYFLQYSC